MQLGIEAEARNVVLRVLRADRLRDSYGDQILRLHERGAQSHRPFELAIVVLGLPRLAAGLRGFEIKRRVIHHRCRTEPFLQRCRVYEWLEARPGLAKRLRHMIELVAIEIKTADQ